LASLALGSCQTKARFFFVDFTSYLYLIAVY
jgi:hypothetical protein